MRKLKSITNRLHSLLFIVLILVVWQLLSATGIVPGYMLPSPVSVVRAFVGEFPVLMQHAGTTLAEAFSGLFFGILAAFAFGILMDNSPFLKRAIYPVLMLTQTVPTISLAPLLVLWMGYGMAPKTVLVFLTCFFPVTVGLMSGFASADPDAIRLLSSMGATKAQIFRHIKMPGALPEFFSGLKISVTYSIVGAVIAEWLGGNAGLGVYMTRVRKSYAFDKMFAVIFLVSALSLILMALTELLQKKVMPWSALPDGERGKGS